MSAVALVCAGGQQAMAQFFANDLTDATSVSNQFNVNLAAEGTFGFSTNNVITVLNPTNTTMTVSRTNLTAGASVYATGTNDADTVRSYLATQYGAYSTNGWKAHVSLESPTAGDPNQNYIFIGLGKGVPSGDNNEPVDGDRAYVRWRHGSTANYGRPRTYLNGSAMETSSGSVNSIGADVFMTYYKDTGIIVFEIDNWSSEGEADGVDITMNLDASSLYFSDSAGATNTEARIFFGGNATVTYSDFWVEEYTPTAPTTPLNLYAWPDSNDLVTVRWDAETLSDSYNLYRSLDASSNYVQIASGVTTNMFVDTDVTNDVTYYYEVSGVNAFGEGSLSASDSAVPNQYLIIGTDGTYAGSPYITKYNLFDGNIATYFDADATGSWAGLDYGDGNAQQILEIQYTMRNWSSAKDRTVGAEIQGSNVSDFNTYETLYTVTTNDLAYPTANVITVTNTTPFRYVRMLSNTTRPLYGIAELSFYTASDYTANGTLIDWLEAYGLTEADDVLDTDGDGLLGWEEYVAGTVPTNSASVLEVNSVEVTTNGVVVAWQSVEGKTYTLYGDTTIVGLGAEDVVMSNIAGVATETSYTNTASAAGTAFYNVSVE
jgi:hypothetical protein